MSSTSRKSWHHNREAKTPSQAHNDEKAKFAGVLTCAIFYGIVVILFFRCTSALLSPLSRARGGIKWMLVAHTIVIFLSVTVFTAINFEILSISYIDNREAHVTAEPPGPLGYQFLTYSTPIGVVSTVMFLLNNLLVDGLLLYRCYVMYAMNSWVITFPCLLYLAAFVMGILLVYYQISQPICSIWRSTTINVGVPYSISVSLDVLLTLMIIVRLVLLSREVRNAMNAPFRISRLYKVVITILSESSALYAVTFLLWIGTWAADNSVQFVFFLLLAQTQVIAPFLVTLQVTNRRASTEGAFSNDIVSIPMSRRVSTGVSGVPISEHSASSTGTVGKSPRELGVNVVTTVELHHDKLQGIA